MTEKLQNALNEQITAELLLKYSNMLWSMKNMFPN